METVELVGRKLELDADGHLKNLNDWDKEVAAEFGRFFKENPDLEVFSRKISAACQSYNIKLVSSTQCHILWQV